MTEFTPLLSSLGGALIGIAAVLLLATHGRIAGMTGILSGVLPPVAADWGWRAAFLIGAIAAPALIVGLFGVPIAFQSVLSAPMLFAGGLIVGIGVHFGAGCTSGHGVCGIARLSRRSIMATVVFMISTTITVFVVRHMLGGLA